MNAITNQPIDVAPATVTTSASRLLTEAKITNQPALRGVFVQPEAEVFLGGPDVTASSGIKLTTGQVLYIDWHTGFQWYAVTASGSTIVRVLPVA